MIVIDLKLMLFLLLLWVGSVVYCVATAVARRRQQQKSPLALLRHNVKALRQQLDEAPYGLLFLNQRAAITYQNRAAQAMLLPVALAELQQEVQTSPKTTGETAVSHTRTLTMPEDRAVRWWLCPLDNGTLVVLSDLSQQRRLERSALLFLNSLSHELRTPLTAVLAHIEVLRAPDLPAAIRDNSLHQIQQETSRLARLVQNLLTLSRLEASGRPELRPVALTLMAEAVISDIILAAEAKDMQLSLQAEAGLPRVLADPDQIKQVLLNLLDNAVKYGRVGDKIIVKLAGHPAGVQVTVQDNGPGIPAQDLSRVTDRLYRARPDVEGSGLGLAIVAEILRQHDSQLHMESTAYGQAEAGDEGTTATFVLSATS